jgi:hypothetical protein
MDSRFVDRSENHNALSKTTYKHPSQASGQRVTSRSFYEKGRQPNAAGEHQFPKGRKLGGQMNEPTLKP